MRARTALAMLVGIGLVVAGTVLEESTVWTVGAVLFLLGAIAALRAVDRRIPRARPRTPGVPAAPGRGAFTGRGRSAAPARRGPPPRYRY